MKRANTMSTITVELILKMKTKFTSSNAEKTNGFISAQMSNFHRKRGRFLVLVLFFVFCLFLFGVVFVCVFACFVLVCVLDDRDSI